MEKVVTFKTPKNNSIEITFNYDKSLVNMVRAIPGRKYIPERQVWIIPVSKNHQTDVLQYFDNSVVLEFEEEIPKRIVPKEYLNELNLRRYSKNTKRAYISAFNKFINYFGTKTASSLSDEDVNSYITYCRHPLYF